MSGAYWWVEIRKRNQLSLNIALWRADSSGLDSLEFDISLNERITMLQRVHSIISPVGYQIITPIWKGGLSGFRLPPRWLKMIDFIHSQSLPPKRGSAPWPSSTGFSAYMKRLQRHYRQLTKNSHDLKGIDTRSQIDIPVYGIMELAYFTYMQA